MIKLLSVAIVAALFLESHQQRPGPFVRPAVPVVKPGTSRPGPFVLPAVPAVKPEHPCDSLTHIECWTDWFDRDDPSGSGDWETYYNLYKENPGKICPKPRAIEAMTLSGLSVAAAGEVIFKNDAASGFICRNVDQPKNKKCSDYRVRFSCHPPFCGGGVCWTNWFDRDNPSGTGDWEHLSDLRNENPGKICEYPLDIEVVTTDTMTPAVSTGENFHTNDAASGFVCRNVDQPKNKKCSDYRVRFSCHPPFCGGGVCWTNWFDRDNPSGTGDWEHLSDLRKENPGKICEYPLDIEVVTTDTMTPAVSTGENFHTFNPTQGFVCLRKDQKSGGCRDYKVRFGCPCKN